MSGNEEKQSIQIINVPSADNTAVKSQKLKRVLNSVRAVLLHQL